MSRSWPTGVRRGWSDGGVSAGSGRLEPRRVEVGELWRREQGAGANQLAEHRNLLTDDQRLDLGDAPSLLTQAQAQLPGNVGLDDAAEERRVAVGRRGEIDVVGATRGERLPQALADRAAVDRSPCSARWTPVAPSMDRARSSLPAHHH